MTTIDKAAKDEIQRQDSMIWGLECENKGLRETLIKRDTEIARLRKAIEEFTLYHRSDLVG